MKRLIAMLCAALFVFAACGDSGGGSCEDVADDTAEAIEDVFADLSIEDLLAAGDELPPAVADFEAQFADLEERAEELGCTDEEMTALMDERLENLDLPAGIADLISP